jgi:hypothetical protein
MKIHSFIRFSGYVLLGIGVGLLMASRYVTAPGTTDFRPAIQHLADAIQKNEASRIKQLAEELANSGELLDVMNTLQKRDRAGKRLVFGVGKEPGSGIEAKIISLSKKPQPQRAIDRESADLAAMAYRVAAIAEVAKLKAPEKDEGMKKKKDWLEWSDEMRKSAEEFAEATKAKNPAAIKNAAARLNSSCNNCHGVFKN